jgi:hypothetical protein
MNSNGYSVLHSPSSAVDDVVVPVHSRYIQATTISRASNVQPWVVCVIEQMVRREIARFFTLCGQKLRHCDSEAIPMNMKCCLRRVATFYIRDRAI